MSILMEISFNEKWRKFSKVRPYLFHCYLLLWYQVVHSLFWDLGPYCIYIGEVGVIVLSLISVLSHLSLIVRPSDVYRQLHCRLYVIRMPYYSLRINPPVLCWYGFCMHLSSNHLLVLLLAYFGSIRSGFDHSAVDALDSTMADIHKQIECYSKNGISSLNWIAVRQYWNPSWSINRTKKSLKYFATLPHLNPLNCVAS